MKKFLGASKKMLAWVLVTGVFSTTAMAAEAVTVEEKRMLTYEEAVTLAKKNNTSLDSLATKVSYLEDNKVEAFDRIGGDKPSDNPGGTVSIMDSARLSRLSTIKSMDTSINTAKLTKEITEIGSEMAVKNYFSIIQNDERNIEILKENLKLQQQLMAQGNLKAGLGLMSSNDLVKLRENTEQMKQSLEMLEISLENDYNAFNKLLGLPSDDRYIINNAIEFGPLELKTTLDIYITGKLSVDPSLEIQKLMVENSEFSMKNMADSSTAADYRTSKYNYEESERSFAETKKDKKRNMESTYNQIRQLETNQKTLESTLKKAQIDYNTAEVNYKVGNITKTELDQSELLLLKSEFDLQKNVFSHDMLKYSFANPCIAGGSTGA